MSQHAPHWDHLNTFFYVASEGSLSAAARAMKTSQPTITRQMQALERAVGEPIFVRHVHGVHLTPRGEALFATAQAMQQSFRAQFDESQSELAGTIRLTASVVVAHYILPKFIANLRQSHPEIAVDILATDAPENVHFREVDIAIRHFTPTQADVIAKNIGSINFGIYASKSYLKRRAAPQSLDEIFAHDLIGFDQNELILQTMQENNFNATRQSFSIRTDNQSLYWKLVEEGCGIGFGQSNIGDQNPNLTRLFPEIAFGEMPAWLAASQALRHSKRQRVVWDALEIFLKENL